MNAGLKALGEVLAMRRAARWTLAGLLLVHTLLLAYSAYVHSPTLNEPGHLVAGLSHWRFGRFEVYRVNPPLVKMVAALPVMAIGYEEDWSSFYEGPGARPEMAMGEDFVAANGERSFFLFMIARWACIPFSWIGAITCYLWARDLYGHCSTALRAVPSQENNSENCSTLHTGRPAGLLAAALWCFEPNILAHASLMTPDIGGTALGVVACYTFWRWLKTPTWTQAALTGVVLGLAELSKTTLILFYPLWPIMWVVYRLAESRETRVERQEPEKSQLSRDKSREPESGQINPSPLYSGERLGEGSSIPHSAIRTPHSYWLREAGMLILRMAIGLYILNLGYAFEGTGTPLKDFHFVSELFAGAEIKNVSRDAQRSTSSDPNKDTTAKKVPDPLSPQAQRHSRAGGNPVSTNRFAPTFLGHLRVPLPKNYLLGIDLQQKDFEHYGRPSYLRGEWQDTGWWYYYLYAAAIKVPLGLWALALLALLLPYVRTHAPCEGAAKREVLTRASLPHWNDTFILLSPAIVIFTVASLKCGFSEHFRYVLPCFPFVFIWIARIVTIFEARVAR